MRKKIRKILSGVVTLCLLAAVVHMPMEAHADGENLEFGRADSISGGTFTVNEKGTVQVSINGENYSGDSERMAVTDLDHTIIVTLTAEEGYNGVLRTGGGSSYTLPSPQTSGQVTTYTFTLGEIGVAQLSEFVALNIDFEASNPGEEEPPMGEEEPQGESWTLDLQIGETVYQGITGDSSVPVSSLEDLNNITVLMQYNDNIGIDVVSDLTGAYGSNAAMSTTCLDEQGRASLEVMVIDSGENYKKVNLQSHYVDTFGGDCPIQDEFYITNITFYVVDFTGVEIVADGAEPDMFDSISSSNITDLGTTTSSNPAVINKFYGSDTIIINGYAGTSVASVALGSGINPNAVTISGNSVTFHSAYYASVPLTVTLSDGTVGYLQINRLGVQIGEYDADASNTNHGSQPGCTFAGTAYDGKYNIVATFYYDAAASYSDYNVVATLTYEDGTSETKVVSGFGETSCVDPATKGGDYVVYSGDKASAPVKVAVSVVEAGATSGNSFGGVCFGAGKGVEVERVDGRLE